MDTRLYGFFALYNVSGRWKRLATQVALQPGMEQPDVHVHACITLAQLAHILAGPEQRVHDDVMDVFW